MGNLETRLASVVLAGVVLAGPAGEGAGAASLAPHRAVYTMSLVSAEASSDIATARGALSIDLEQSCDGWAYTQWTRLERESSTGEATDLVLEFSSFESLDALSYQFTSRALVDDTVVDEHRGMAERDEAEAAGEALYALPDRRRVVLPAGTMFPLQYTLLVLEAAERGDALVFRRFFDGVRPDDSPFDANAVILGGPKSSSEQMPAEVETEAPGLLAQQWWPMRVAMFSGVGQGALPILEYELSIQSNGVAREYVFDYGDFVMRADLVRIEPGDVPDCN